MTINVEDETGRGIEGVDVEGTARRVIEAALDYEGCPYEAEVNLLLTDNEGIRILNREHRQIDRPTDVLSFPMLDFEAPADFSTAETDEADCFNPETGELVLGDIIISVDKVVEQAEKYGHSREREFAFLTAHSMLEWNRGELWISGNNFLQIFWITVSGPLANRRQYLLKYPQSVEI